MTVHCEWIERNLEGIFCDGLSAEDSQVARMHIESCVSCQREVRALNAIDPLVKRYFRRELQVARRPRHVNTVRAFGLSGAAVAVFAVLLFVGFRSPQTNSLAPIASQPPQSGGTVSVESIPPVKDEARTPENETETPVERSKRTKPIPQPDQVPNPKLVVPPITPTSPEFVVTDAAGYQHTLQDYRGHVVVIAIWNARQMEPALNFERLYKAYGTNPKFRFLGVTNERQKKPTNLTFPVVYNQGSKLFGAQVGEFVVVDPTGSIEFRGSLMKDLEALRKTLQAK
jgi:hypothetical protein